MPCHPHPPQMTPSFEIKPILSHVFPLVWKPLGIIIVSTNLVLTKAKKLIIAIIICSDASEGVVWK